MRSPAYRLRERIEHWPSRGARALGRARRAPPPLLVLLAPDRGVGRAVRPRDAGRVPHDGHLLREDLRRGRRRRRPTTRRPTTGSDRAYRIYPAEFEPNFHELEYFVPFDRGREAIAAMRELMLARQPASVFPMEVRTVAADDAYLASELRDADDGDLRLGRARHRLRAVPARRRSPARRVRRARALGQAPLPHARRSSPRATPRAGDFIDLRRELDPEGVFLNDHLRPLFA